MVGCPVVLMWRLTVNRGSLAGSRDEGHGRTNEDEKLTTIDMVGRRWKAGRPSGMCCSTALPPSLPHPGLFISRRPSDVVTFYHKHTRNGSQIACLPAAVWYASGVRSYWCAWWWFCGHMLWNNVQPHLTEWLPYCRSLSLSASSWLLQNLYSNMNIRLLFSLESGNKSTESWLKKTSVVVSEIWQQKWQRLFHQANYCSFDGWPQRCRTCFSFMSVFSVVWRMLLVYVGLKGVLRSKKWISQNYIRRVVYAYTSYFR